MAVPTSTPAEKKRSALDEVSTGIPTSSTPAIRHAPAINTRRFLTASSMSPPSPYANPPLNAGGARKFRLANDLKQGDAVPLEPLPGLFLRLLKAAYSSFRCPCRCCCWTIGLFRLARSASRIQATAKSITVARFAGLTIRRARIRQRRANAATRDRSHRRGNWSISHSPPQSRITKFVSNCSKKIPKPQAVPATSEQAPSLTDSEVQ
jgi:hypothetical protein